MTVGGQQQASFPTNSLTVAKHPITATYAGNGTFSASPPSNTVNQAINQGSTQTTLTISPSTGVYGQPTTLLTTA